MFRTNNCSRALQLQQLSQLQLLYTPVVTLDFLRSVNWKLCPLIVFQMEHFNRAVQIRARAELSVSLRPPATPTASKSSFQFYKWSISNFILFFTRLPAVLNKRRKKNVVNKPY